jgi:hypothetical protein
MKLCHACGAEWTEKDPPGFSAECAGCRAPMHCCMNCKFYTPGHHNDCLEPEAEMVRDRQAQNRCDWFQLADRRPGGGRPEPGADRAARARARLDELFRKPGEKRP